MMSNRVYLALAGSLGSMVAAFGRLLVRMLCSVRTGIGLISGRPVHVRLRGLDKVCVGLEF